MAPRLGRVHSSMSPKGVEHSKIIVPGVVAVWCIHQCRRKALSTAPDRSSPVVATDSGAFINVAERR